MTLRHTIDTIRGIARNHPGVGDKIVLPSRAVNELLRDYDRLDNEARAAYEERHPGYRPSFQVRMRWWLLDCFGAKIADDKAERNHRFLEEALELVQACGCTRSEALQLVDYTYSRPVGDRFQEVGGVMTTLAALCCAQEVDMQHAGETELTRIWGKVEQIRAKQAAKPKHSPLPMRVDRGSIGWRADEMKGSEPLGY